MKEEQECTITYDYAIKQVRVYSTRISIIRNMLKRLGNQEGIIHNGNFLYIPLSYCRNPMSITRILTKEDITEDESN